MKFSFKLEEIKYVKISYKDSDGYIENIKAAIKDINEKEILICTRYMNSLDIDLPQEIDFSVICNDGLYKTKTILKSAEADEPYIFFYLETPAGIEYQQNREYFRVPVDYNCIYKVRENNQFIEYSAKTYDISANGVSIILEDHIISEKPCELSLNINGIDILTHARYIRSEKIDEGYRISFSFTSISDLDRDFLSQVCIKKQLQDRKNAIR